MKRILALLLMVFSIPVLANDKPKPNEEAVKKVITDLFDAMRESQGPKAAALFQPNARMLTALQNADGNTRLAESPVASFIDAIGREKNEIWDERITQWDIKIDGPMAMAWTVYEFYRGESFSHCGVNVFTLFHNGEDWKIVQIIDTRKTEGCI